MPSRGAGRAVFALRRKLGRVGFVFALVAAAFLVTRGLGFAALHAGAAKTLPRFAGGWERHDSDLLQGASPSKLVEPTVRWDALFYIAIAREGYPPPRVETVYHVNFFPLYPLIVRGVDSLIDNTFTAALLVSNLCAFAGALLVGCWRRPGQRAMDGPRAAVLLLAFPGSHFLSLPYTEGLFLLLVVSSLVALDRDRPLVSGLLAGLAGATRSAGVALAAGLGWAVLERLRKLSMRPGRGQPWRLLPWLAALLISFSGIGAWSYYCHRRYGDALYWMHSQASFGRKLSAFGVIRGLFAFNVDPDYYLVTIACLVLLVLALRRRLDAVNVAGAVLVLLPMATGTLKAMIRYQTVNAPLLQEAPRHLRRWRFPAVVVASTFLMMVEAWLYGRGYGHN